MADLLPWSSPASGTTGVNVDLFGTVLRFADPIVLALLPVVPALAFLNVHRERRHGGALLFSSLSLLPGRPRTVRARLRPLLPALRLAALALMIVALARPQVARAAHESAKGIDIAIAIDVSGSMSETGFGGGNVSKIAAVKRVVDGFVGGLQNDRVGLVVFGTEALLLSPLTLDHAAVRHLVDQLDTSGRLTNGASTAIGTGLATALNALRASSARSKVAILLTDGENNAGDIMPLDAAKAAKLLGIRVYTIGAILRSQRRQGTVEVDEALMREMAQTTGGRYFAVSDETALRQIYAEIAQLERSRLGVRPELASYDDVMLPFLLAGVLLLVGELLLSLTVFRRAP